MVPSSLQAFGPDAAFGRAFSSQQVQSDVPQDSEVLWAVSFSHPAIVFSESDIQHPMHLILDLPVGARGMEQLLGVAFQAGDEISLVHTLSLTDASFGLNHANRLQALPVGE